MRKLNLKLVRDVKTGKAQFAAVSLIVFFGVASFLGTYAAYLNLDASYNASFQELRMADYWISVAEVEQKAVRDMEKIEGVTAQGRIVDEVGIELGGTIGERIEGRVISLPRYMHPKINDVLVKSGNYFSPNFAREILLNKHFADYHGLGPGDWVTLKLGNNSLRFRIAGLVVSP